MARITIRLTADARRRARNREEVERAALAAFEAAGRGEIHFAPFLAAGHQYALSSRMILEVDWLPNRVLRHPGTIGRAPPRKAQPG